MGGIGSVGSNGEQQPCGRPAPPEGHAGDSRDQRTRLCGTELGRRPCAPDDPARSRSERDRDHLGPHRLPALGIGGDGNSRQARRRVRQGARARLDAPDPRRRHPARRGLAHTRPPDRGACHPGCRWRDLSALVRDRAGRVSGRAGRRKHRPAVRDPRDRCGYRDRRRRCDRRAPGMAVAVLAPARGDRRRGVLYVALRAGVARTDPGPPELARGRADERRDLDAADRGQPDDRLGLDVVTDARAVRRRRARSAARGSRSSCGARRL